MSFLSYIYCCISASCTFGIGVTESILFAVLLIEKYSLAICIQRYNKFRILTTYMLYVCEMRSIFIRIERNVISYLVDHTYQSSDDEISAIFQEENH